MLTFREMKPMSRKRSKYILMALLTVIVVGVLLVSKRFSSSSSQEADAAKKSLLLNSFTQNGVQVDIRLEKDQMGQMSLAATYRPIREHFHLYSKDLPRDGIDGVGRPTLLAIASPNEVQPLGQLSESVSSINLNATWSQQPVPVYPEGPVTLRLPIKLPEASSMPVTAELSVTYMTCSDTTCLPPVEEKIIPVTL